MSKRCHYCRAAPGDTRDHIVPKSRGGAKAAWNIVKACDSCNNAKADHWPTCSCPRCERVVGLHALMGVRPA